jgi:RND family efflux transporter MFP subunit
MVLKYSDFSKEIVSNGKLTAFQKAELKFRTSEIVAEIHVKNGERVAKNQVIAKLDDFILSNTLKQNLNQVGKARIDMQDALLGQGYDYRDTARIPVTSMNTARIRSGYDQAVTNLELAEYNLRSAVLKAPFSGIVANLILKQGNMSSVSEKFCSIINDSRFEAEFPILESELVSVKNGQSVRIIPFSYNNIIVKGEVARINPVVDQNGMVKVWAVCDNTDHKLFEGMNVKIVLEEKVSHQLVVPKQAIVLRSEKQVIFIYSSGKAKWVYVKTGLENLSSFTITEGLQPGDSVIYDGNINLAHDAEVEIE